GARDERGDAGPGFARWAHRRAAGGWVRARLQVEPLSEPRSRSARDAVGVAVGQVGARLALELVGGLWAECRHGPGDGCGRRALSRGSDAPQDELAGRAVAVDDWHLAVAAGAHVHPGARAEHRPDVAVSAAVHVAP